MKYELNKNINGPIYVTEKDLIKQNANCPDSEKVGEGPGSCGGNKNSSNDIKQTVQSLHQKRSEGHITLRNKLTSLFTDNKKFQVTGRLKTPQSIQEKMFRKGVDDPAKFDDISGLRIITSDAKSTQEAINILKNKFNGVIKPGTEDNYIENPKETGYRAYHVTLMSGGEPHEVQVRTQRFNDWAETHHAVYKGEEWTKNANTQATKDYFNKMAIVFQRLDENKNPGNVPKCPSELAEIKLCLSI